MLKINIIKQIIMKSLLLFVFLVAATIGKAQPIFIRNEPPKLIFDKGEGFLLEGPAMSKEGILYFSDVIATNISGMKAGVIWMYNPETGITKVFRSPSGMACGLMFDQLGRLVVCEADDYGGQRVTRTDMQTGLSKIIAGKFEGKRFNAPNDVAIDEKGNIYFTDIKALNDGPMPQPVHGVYKIDTSGNIELIIAYIRKPNGILVSPDQKTLYISTADNISNGNISKSYKGDKPKISGKLLAYDLQEDGSATFRGELVDFGSVYADGMTIDTEGNIYVTLTFSNKLSVFSPNGEKLDEIKLPNGPVTNVTFGRGKYASTLFITSGKNLYTVQTNKTGYNIPFKD